MTKRGNVGRYLLGLGIGTFIGVALSVGPLSRTDWGLVTVCVVAVAVGGIGFEMICYAAQEGTQR